MRKAILLLLAILATIGDLLSQNNARLLDQPMKVKELKVKITANAIIASTFVEIEFCNSKSTEIEGQYQFKLEPGQVITAFQLDLNGKYRDGSIEEKWKAQNAYNTIVGKRIDPALLVMGSPNSYTLNVYPVPAGGCRKVTLTIQQLLKDKYNSLEYSLPLSMPDTVGAFNLNIDVQSDQGGIDAGGLIADQRFIRKGIQYEMSWRKERMIVKDQVKFSVQIPSRNKICVTPNGSNTLFAVRVNPSVPKEYEIHPKQVTVFWDASGSASNRSIKKEINFLRQFVSVHRIMQLTIIPFNDRLLDTVIFNSPYQSSYRWAQYLQDLDYVGATQLGCIKISDPSSFLMIFTDGNNTFGNRKPRTNNALTFWVHASSGVENKSFSSLVGTSGGRLIDLNRTSMPDALQVSSKATNWLLDVTSASGKIVIEQQLPIELNSTILLCGIHPAQMDTLYLHYGNQQGITKVEKIVIEKGEDCSSINHRIAMLQSFDNMINSGYWEDVLDFGLREKVVTPRTAFIVLERVEDYIKYNISPPKDLEEECQRLNYVKKDTRNERRKLKKQDEYSTLESVVRSYNIRLKTWDPLASQAYVNLQELVEIKASQQMNNQIVTSSTSSGNELVGNVAGLSVTGSKNLEEVVVIGYGSMRRRDLTSSVTVINSRELFPFGSIDQALAGRVSGLMVVPRENGLPGDLSTIRIRGASSSGMGSPLYVLDGVPVTGNVSNLINVNDIESITVLKDIQASALYGSRAVYGAIVITSKKGFRNYYRGYNSSKYRLKDMEDVEYLQEIKSVGLNEKRIVYEKLRQDHLTDPGFYFDMAQHFFEVGITEQALSILKNAAEAGNGSLQLLRGMGFILENWGEFEEAILIYEQLLEDSPSSLFFYRDLAWAYYQNGNIQKAVDLLYQGIKMGRGSKNIPLQTSMLNELNSIIAVYKEKLDLSSIPQSLIRPMPVELRIFLDCNQEDMYDVTIDEPGSEMCKRGVRTKNGGVLYSESEWYSGSFADYSNRDMEPGRYKIVVNYWDSNPYSLKIPSVVRIMTFRNFGKENQSIKIENVMLDNQTGTIEIADYKF